MSDVHASCKLDISVPASFAHLLVAKGSVCINGTSLTVNNVEDDEINPPSLELNNLRPEDLKAYSPARNPERIMQGDEEDQFREDS